MPLNVLALFEVLERYRRSPTLTLLGELVLHSAVMATPRPETLKLIQYLIKTVPESLEAKSSDGYTPLALAFSLHRLDAAKMLIEAGGDQTARDSKGNNILHLLLSPINSGVYGQFKAATDEKTLQPMLDLIDKRLISSLLSERSSRDPGSLTPIANWLRHSRQNQDNTEVLRVLLNFATDTGNEHLELLDATGDTPLHWIVKSQFQAWLKTILEYRPDLLYRENSVGRTPYELAEDAYIAERVRDVPGSERRSHISFGGNRGQPQSIKDRDSKTFAADFVAPETVSKESIWRICGEFVQKHPSNRKLVSLLDANEVAKRLATRNQAVRASRDKERLGSEAGSDVEDEDNDDANRDEVTWWYGTAPMEDGIVQSDHVYGGFLPTRLPYGPAYNYKY